MLCSDLLWLVPTLARLVEPIVFFSLSRSLPRLSLSLCVCLCLTDFFVVVFLADCLDYPVRPRDLTKLPPLNYAPALSVRQRDKTVTTSDETIDKTVKSQESRVKRQTGSTNTLLVDCCMPASTRSALG